MASPTCPCCIFLPDDLFLPENLKTTSSGGDNGMLSPQEALERLVAIPLVDTHGHAHLERELHASYSMENTPSCSLETISLSCAVQVADWQACLDYCASSNSILPALGVHPWYLLNLPKDYLETLETLLQAHPHAMVGEIGLCKYAKFLRTYPEGKAAGLELQRSVFEAQTKLAVKYQRPISVHCVNQHGVLLKSLKSQPELPPTIGMHSFSGTAHHVKELLKLEQHHKSKTKFYFGFSHIINYEMNSSEKSKRQTVQAIQAVPSDRLLSESDVHASSDVPVGTAGSIAYLAHVLEEQSSLEEVAAQTARNGLAFMKSIVKKGRETT